MQLLKEWTGVQERIVQKVRRGQLSSRADLLAEEEPLEIKIASGALDARQYQSLAITMRTPGQDADLVTGFLFTEGIIARPQQLQAVRHVGQALATTSQDNVILAELDPSTGFDTERFSRHFYTSSSCGVCGKTSIEMVRSVSCYYPRNGFPKLSDSVLYNLPDRLRHAQSLFEQTGGIHASGLFTPEGELVLMREDVGRHNALDKLIGAALQQDIFPLRNHIVLVSGRISFELVQKAAMAGVPVLAAVGAPSSLAVSLAEEHGMTLVGFLRDGRCNIYHDQNRIQFQAKEIYETSL